MVMSNPINVMRQSIMPLRPSRRIDRLRFMEGSHCQLAVMESLLVSRVHKLQQNPKRTAAGKILVEERRYPLMLLLWFIINLPVSLSAYDCRQSHMI
jgi:hypothetical protein